MSNKEPFRYKIHTNSYELGNRASKLHKNLNLRLIKHVSKMVDQPSDQFLEGRKLLEIGTGVGRLYIALREFECKYQGIEPSTEMFEYCKQNFSNDSNFDIQNIRLEEIPNEYRAKFDIVFMVHVLEHANDSYMALAWLERLKEFVAQGGYLIVKGPHFPSYGSKFWDIDYSHNYVTTRNNTCELLQEAGWKIVASRLVVGLPGGGQLITRGLAVVLLKLVPEDFLNWALSKFFRRQNVFSNLLTAYFRTDYLILARKISDTI